MSNRRENPISKFGFYSTYESRRSANRSEGIYKDGRKIADMWRLSLGCELVETETGAKLEILQKSAQDGFMSEGVVVPILEEALLAENGVRIMHLGTPIGAALHWGSERLEIRRVGARIVVMRGEEPLAEFMPTWRDLDVEEGVLGRVFVSGLPEEHDANRLGMFFAYVGALI